MPMPNPLLESDSVECAHKGKVLLQSSTKDLGSTQLKQIFSYHF
ncbi:hypothetical protein [Helicobacter sp. T3_23-1059]